MSSALAEISRQAATLPANDKLSLAKVMLELADEPGEPADEVAQAWDKEIQRRVTELRTGKVKAVPLAEVQCKIEQMLRR